MDFILFVNHQIDLIQVPKSYGLWLTREVVRAARYRASVLDFVMIPEPARPEP
jgi:hypothetical protein